MRFGRRGLRLAALPAGASLSGIGAQLKADNGRFQAALAVQVRLLVFSAPVPTTIASNATPFPGRKVEIDIALVDWRVGVEVQGGIWRKRGGAHSRPANIERDIEKQQLALMHGWIIIPVTTRQVKSGRALATIAAVLRQRGFLCASTTPRGNLTAVTSPRKSASRSPRRTTRRRSLASP
jgi:hypothetical protein